MAGWAALILCFFLLPAWAQESSAPAKDTTAKNTAVAVNTEDYKLGAGDKVHIVVFGENDLTGDYDVDGSGNVRMSLIGEVEAAGISLRDFEKRVKTALDNGYMKDAQVSVSVVNYRPFYIIGEVNKPGEYPYVNNMSVLNAIALAGGYTYRANQGDVYIQRSGDTEEKTYPADQNTKIYPGDIVRVRERFF